MGKDTIKENETPRTKTTGTCVKKPEEGHVRGVPPIGKARGWCAPGGPIGIRKKKKRRSYGVSQKTGKGKGPGKLQLPHTW